MSGVVYDAGVLVAADRSVRRAWAMHRVRLEEGTVPLVPSVVVAQVSRSPRQVQLRRFLAGCDVVDFDEPSAHTVGMLLGATGTVDVVDAAVVVLASTLQAVIVTSDPKDLTTLVQASGVRIHLEKA